jgi:hypothetical protein
MAKQVLKGQFYEFDATQMSREVGNALSERDALVRVSFGRDVYTPAPGDAKRLARNVDPNQPEWDRAGATGYFPHYHPAGVHPVVLPSGKRDGYGHIFYGQRGEDAPAWKDKKEVARVGQVLIWQAESGSAFFFKTGMQIDADGAPRAYHPGRTQGLDNLDNAGKPGNWWALVTDSKGNPVVQGPRDPAPGFYVSTTALQNPAWPKIDPRRYVDSTTIPYFVLPKHTLDKLGARLGDLGLVMNCKNRHSSCAIYADVGPSHEIGEGSIALAKALGINASPRGGGTDGDVLYVVFPGSGSGSPKTFAGIKAASEYRYRAWGGRDRLEAYFPEDLA